MNDSVKSQLTYKDAGVDIDAGERLVEKIKPLAKATQRPECIGGLGGFGGLFQLNTTGLENPVLVSGTDGVGTKLKLAIEADRHDTIGIDLVAMCVNDILVCGAEPLFFLDYFATAALNPDQGAEVVSGIAEGCKQAGAALLGGETAEMPGMYSGSDYDLAGFAVGVVDKAKIIDGSKVTPGDTIIGIESSGPHSNGYSLIRKILETSNSALDSILAGRTMLDWLLEPTRIYATAIKRIIDEIDIHGIAHITGGGLPGNVNRSIGKQADAVINLASWEFPEIFKWIQENGNVSTEEMLRTFNCGIGMTVIVPADSAQQTIDILNGAGETAHVVGRIEPGKGQVRLA